LSGRDPGGDELGLAGPQRVEGRLAVTGQDVKQCLGGDLGIDRVGRGRAISIRMLLGSRT
jgi:hypothetical protein